MNKNFRFLLPILCIVLSTYSAQAQSGLDSNGYVLNDGESFQQLFDSLTNGLIPSRIPYGVLYDRVLSHTWPPEWHNGDTVSRYSLFQDWWDMEHCRVGTTTEGTYEAMRRGEHKKSNLFLNFSL